MNDAQKSLLEVLKEQGDGIWEEFYPHTGWLPVGVDSKGIYAINIYELLKLFRKGNIGDVKKVFVKITYSGLGIKEKILNRKQRRLSIQGYEGLHSTEELWMVPFKTASGVINMADVLKETDYDKEGKILGFIGSNNTSERVIDRVSVMEEIHTVICCENNKIIKKVERRIEQFEEIQAKLLQINNNIQMKRYESTDFIEFMQTIIALLQDQGFTIKNANENLGLITAYKDLMCVDEWMKHRVGFESVYQTVKRIEANIIIIRSENGSIEIRISLVAKGINNRNGILWIRPIYDAALYKKIFSRIKYKEIPSGIK